MDTIHPLKADCSAEARAGNRWIARRGVAAFLVVLTDRCERTSYGQMRRSLAAFAVLVAASAPAHAQDPGSFYVFAGVAAAHQDGPSGEMYETYVTAPGGTTASWLVGGGVFLTRVISLEGEWSSTGWMTSTQPSRYEMTFNEERRDRFFSVLARFSLPRGARLRIEPVAGVIVTRPEARSQVDYYDFGAPPRLRERGPRVEHRLDTGVGVTVGCDARIGGRRFALLPYFRLSDTGVDGGRYDASSDHREVGAIFPGGYPRWTTRAGAALRVDF